MKAVPANEACTRDGHWQALLSKRMKAVPANEACTRDGHWQALLSKRMKAVPANEACAIRISGMTITSVVPEAAKLLSGIHASARNYVCEITVLK
jgi:hypothetical protein